MEVSGPNGVSSDGPFEFDSLAGEVRDGDIRYLLIRPDVLMGLFGNLESAARRDALLAIKNSAFECGKASMYEYRKLEFSSPDEMLQFFCASAARLGWGSFAYEISEAGMPVFEVTNSPFAAGYGTSDQPVCAPVVGILEAFAEVFLDKSQIMQEVACAAQGADRCRFAVTESSAKG